MLASNEHSERIWGWGRCRSSLVSDFQLTSLTYGPGAVDAHAPDDFTDLSMGVHQIDGIHRQHRPFVRHHSNFETIADSSIIGTLHVGRKCVCYFPHVPTSQSDSSDRMLHPKQWKAT